MSNLETYELYSVNGFANRCRRTIKELEERENTRFSNEEKIDIVKSLCGYGSTGAQINGLLKVIKELDYNEYMKCKSLLKNRY